MREGDYLNLGAGAEMGIYYCTDWLTEIPEEIDHYVADTNFTMPMEIYLYNNYGGFYEKIFAWTPNEEQWWITGFNPNHVDRVDVNTEVMIGRVDFSGYEDLYCQLKNTTNEEYINTYNEAAVKYLIFDDNNYYVWTIWY